MTHVADLIEIATVKLDLEGKRGILVAWQSGEITPERACALLDRMEAVELHRLAVAWDVELRLPMSKREKQVVERARDVNTWIDRHIDVLDEDTLTDCEDFIFGSLSRADVLKRILDLYAAAPGPK